MNSALSGHLLRYAFSSILLLFSHTTSMAGGLIGDLINNVAPGVGTALDNVNRDIKNAVPIYKDLEEGVSNTVNEALVQAGAPALQELIARSRDDALANGVEPIPQNIRSNLSGFIPDDIMDIARFRVGGGGDLTLQVNSIRYGKATAITLDYVIVFKEQSDALYNPVLWAHELTHVIQYQTWGMKDFAIRYTRSYESVEKEAYDAEARYVAFTAQTNAAQNNNQDVAHSLNAPIRQFAGTQPSNICGSWAGACQIDGIGPVGTPCWCGTQAGPVTGALIPAGMQTNAPAGFPSGFVMRACGCWGPNPVPFAAEPQCASGQVIAAGCSFMCAPNAQAYGYMCN